MSSPFKNGVVYLIIPTADLTTEMINISKKHFNVTSGTLRKSSDTTQTILKVKEPVDPLFNGYTWYTHKEIDEIVTGGGW